ncbi:MAG: alpha/beta fold hydrolase [Sphingomicrobium sp.]
MAAWTDRFWNSVDGLKLHYRDYDGPRDRPPIICLPGLTRNARDFEPVAERFAGDWRVLAVDLRGRGLSDYDPKPEQYLPVVYAADILKMLDQLGIADAVFFGTSLGGIVTMVLAGTDNERIAGALLNDIGPELDQAGIDWIGSYVGNDIRYRSWDEIRDALAARSGAKFPHWDQGAWERFARRIGREAEDGSIGFDYDMAIAANFHAAADAPPMNAWPHFQALDGRPVTILRGALTDLLDAEIAERMANELSDAELVTIPDVGHTPSFEEPESIAAAERLLARVLARDA